MLKKLKSLVSTLCLFFITAFILVNPATAFEQITHFNSDITINQNTSLQIVETIDYTTNESKHGIYRYIPIRYTRNGLNYTTRIHSIRITDPDGKGIPFERSWENGNVTLKIGDGDVTFTGPKTYVISYQVDNAVQQVENPNPTTPNQANSNSTIPELFWDITGEGWQIDIASTSAQVTTPFAAIVRVACYSGAVGSDDGKCSSQTINPQQATFTYPQMISYGDNMTVALQLDPSGFLLFPTATEKLLKHIQDNLGLLPLLLPGLGMAFWWWKRGRDTVFTSWNVFNHDTNQTQTTAPLLSWRHIPMVYEPIKELTPGEAGALHDEKVDNQDIIAEIIDLARQKFLKIERLEKKSLFKTTVDYQFTQLKEASPLLPKHQTYLLTNLFKLDKTVKLSALKGTFYTHMEQTKKLIFQSLSAKGMFAQNPSTVRSLGVSVAIVATVVVGYWGIYLLTLGMWWALPIFAISLLIAFLAGYHLPAKTAQGSNFAWQVRGLRQNIYYGAWREKIKEKHLFFEEVLPFAVALGVVNQLSNDMKKLNVKEPTYVTGTSHGWSTPTFINAFSNQASSNLSYNPSSSDWSSGSGFSGGSSGGGGGGGGGGSW
jgi:uncharacterized membrane protein YgcG